MRPRAITRAGLASVVAAVGLVAWAEWVDARSSRRMLGTGARGRHDALRREAVVVLGYGNRGPRANLINRFRVRAGLRSIDPAAESTLVLCGGTVEGPEPEAVILARFARDECGYTGALVLETESRSTWQNIRNAIPLIEDADAIKIVSNAPHALVGREYLHRLRPDLAARLVAGEEHRLGEVVPIKIVAALRMLWFRLRSRD
ncbi:hypothetical protein GCM10025768_16370 [Microbacterium pseudoresistens]|uniref:DUF218 domain-containing protein n=1 Tax=Microbacterium pseudoresistens TaxID=640634 RepID=A0A7Y9ESL0_9MICO|nr:YdcF family protein [Microbacterium pseudoresistens]NYD53011.1 hypothetical protein [Microbacterium pseudoresistens]